MSKLRGFTLMEVMIAVAIVAILTAIAVPAYTDYIQRGKIIEATSTMLDMRVKLEQYFQDNRTYVGFTDSRVASGTCLPNPAPASTGVKYFTYTCPVLTASAYTIQAAGVPTQGMTSFQYSVDQSNNRLTVLLPSNWTGAGSTCWVLKKDGSC